MYIKLNNEINQIYMCNLKNCSLLILLYVVKGL